jgi:glycosyltransferase involved in cell wall biosynthesis
MNILILLKSFNYPPRNGGDQAVFNAIKKLSPRVQFHLLNTDNSINGKISTQSFQKDYPSIPTIIYPLINNNKYQYIKNKCLRISNFINNRNGNRNKVNMQHLNFYDAQLDYYDDFYRFLNDYINKHNIHIVQGEFHFTLGFLKGIISPVKKVFVHHEIQFIVEHQRLTQKKQLSTDDNYFYNQQRQQEINALNACDAIITLSETDKQKLIENGVHTPIFASFAQIQLSQPKIFFPVTIQKKVVFIGPETHIPNKQGLEWFMNNVFPLLRKQEPNIIINVIGNWKKETKENWEQKYAGINFLGYVDNLYTAIANSILIVPLFQGSGIRMKILEACNAGIPFVATSIGAEGLNFTSGKNCYITDDATQFAESIIELVNNQELANKFIQNSINHIHQEFSDERFIESRMVCYNSLLKI